MERKLTVKNFIIVFSAWVGLFVFITLPLVGMFYVLILENFLLIPVWLIIFLFCLSILDYLKDFTTRCDTSPDLFFYVLIGLFILFILVCYCLNQLYC